LSISNAYEFEKICNLYKVFLLFVFSKVKSFINNKSEEFKIMKKTSKFKKVLMIDKYEAMDKVFNKLV